MRKVEQMEIIVAVDENYGIGKTEIFWLIFRLTSSVLRR